MIERSGLDRAKALEILTGGAPGSPLVKTLAVRMTTPDFTPNFLLRLMAKDLGLAQDAAASVGAKAPFGAQALAMFRQFVEQGGGTKDFSAIMTMIRDAK